MIFNSKAELVEWNGWYFTTSETGLTDTDPVRFYLLSSEEAVNVTATDQLDSGWTTIDSSSRLHHRDLGTTTLFHGEYSTSRARGHVEVRLTALT